MQLDRSNWDQWAQYLQQYHLLGFACFLLDAAGPFRIIAAQSLLLTSPFTSNTIYKNFAQILEDEKLSKEFNNYLKTKGINE